MQKRWILLWMYLFLIICNTLVTISMNIAIVPMTNQSSSTANANETTADVCQNKTFQWDKSVNNEICKNQHLKTETYNWSQGDQNSILSGYYWLSWLAIFPGGLLSQKFGSKIVAAYAQGISSLMSSLIPIFAATGPQPVTCIRMVQGFFSMVSIPGSAFTIIGSWIPPEEKGKFVLLSTLSQIYTVAISSIIFGIVAEYTNWKYIFHLTSFFGLVWLILWCRLIYDTPEKHPDISTREINYIKQSLQTCSDAGKYETIAQVSIPWKGILTSFPFYVCAAASSTNGWHFTMLTTYTPTYLKSMYGLNNEQVGFVNSFPPFVAGVIMFVAAYISDSSIKKKWLSITNTRKCFTFFGGIVSAIPLIIIADTEYNITLVVACLVIATSARNLGNLGTNVVVMDMSPKFCGILDGIAGTFSAILTLALTNFTNSLSYSTSTREMWKIVFRTTGAICIVSSTLFVAFGTAEIQPWNYKPTKLKQNPEDTHFAKLTGKNYGAEISK